MFYCSIRGSYECSSVIHNVHVWPPGVEDAASLCFCAAIGVISGGRDNLCCLLWWGHTAYLALNAYILIESFTFTSPSHVILCISIGSHTSICLVNIVSICRSHIWLLWRKPDCNRCKGHSWYFCHLSCAVPLLAGWIHWSGSHETGLKDYSYNHYLSLSSDTFCTDHFLCCIVLHTSIYVMFVLCLCARCLAQLCCCCAWWLCLTRRTNRLQRAASLSQWVSWCCSLAFLWEATAAMLSTPPETSHPESLLP